MGLIDWFCFNSGRMPDSSELLDKEDKVKLKRCIYGLQRHGLPPVTTHNVVDDWNDPVLNSVRRCNLFNTVHDRVKVRFDVAKLLGGSFNKNYPKVLAFNICSSFLRSFSTLNFYRQPTHCLVWTMKSLCEDVIWECFRATMSLGATLQPNAQLWEFLLSPLIYQVPVPYVIVVLIFIKMFSNFTQNCLLAYSNNR